MSFWISSKKEKAIGTRGGQFREDSPAKRHLHADAFFVCISINCLSVRTSGRPSPVSAAKKDTTDENGEDHIHLLDAETRPFVSSNDQLYVILFGSAPGVIVIASMSMHYKKAGSQPLIEKGGWESFGL